jgi:DNA (cytosine-5)-methyltransferase 1
MASQSNKHKLNTFHLFAGAGGGILADLLLGHNPIGACEIEPYPRDVLLARQRDGHLPNFPIWDDVCTLDGTPWRGTVDVLCGGFPCQDISAAGKGAGITGERSGLWKEYARLIGEMRPRFVFAENSPLLRTRGLGVVLEDLASLGYNARWGIMGAWHVGAPHKRDRMWVLAYAASKGLERLGRSIEGGEVRERRICPSKMRQDFWKNTVSEIARMDDGVADRVDRSRRFKAIGNGQVPQCAAMAFTTLSQRLI